MTKDDLRTGMLVQTRDGQWWIVQLNTERCKCYNSTNIIVEYETGEFELLDNYNEDLLVIEEEKEYDIMKVARAENPNFPIMFIVKGKPVEEIYGFEILWERQEVNPEVVQLQKRIGELQKQLNDAQERLRKIKGE